MLDNFERGKSYEVKKKWSDPPFIEKLRMKNFRYELKVGEILRFRGPNFTGAEFYDKDNNLVILPARVAFRILGHLTPTPADTTRR